jgi:hypothetical protein
LADDGCATDCGQPTTKTIQPRRKRA